jgi:hypothetical protein
MMTGLGLVTGVTVGVGPAMAASGTDQGAARSEGGANAQARSDRGDRLVGYFRSWRMCERAGEFGEDEGYWDDYDCIPVRAGAFRTRVALVVDFDDWGHGWSGHWPGRWWVGGWWPGHGNWDHDWGWPGNGWGNNGWGNNGWGNNGWGNNNHKGHHKHHDNDGDDGGNDDGGGNDNFGPGSHQGLRG